MVQVICEKQNSKGNSLWFICSIGFNIDFVGFKWGMRGYWWWVGGSWVGAGILVINIKNESTTIETLESDLKMIKQNVCYWACARGPLSEKT